MALIDGELVVREPVAGDAPAVSAAVRMSLRELQPWMPWATDDYDEVVAGAWIRGEFGDEHRFILVVDGQCVGSCGMNNVDPLNHRANLGYWLRSDATGRGYATRATYLVARYGIEHLGFHRLEIMMSVHNEQSVKVAQRSGARYEGVARSRLFLRGDHHDAHIFSVTAADLAGQTPRYL